MLLHCWLGIQHLEVCALKHLDLTEKGKLADFGSPGKWLLKLRCVFVCSLAILLALLVRFSMSYLEVIGTGS